MDLGYAVMWWIVAGVLIAAELATGTFYLLLLALGAAAAAAVAHADGPLAFQLLAAAAFAAGTVLLWYRRRGRLKGQAAARRMDLDVGERVRVDRWEADGSSRVQYRGAAWDARYAGTGTPSPGVYRIAAIDGSRLVLDQAMP